MKQNRILILILITTLLIMGCEENGTNGNDDGPAANEVWMQNIAFVPETLTVAAGTTVSWINKDDVLHNVTAEGFTSSTNLGEGETYSYTFDQAGTFDYECTLHPGMEGTIVVAAP
ncbi:MAG: cupredoxin domain-containing protein [Bacteroidales bacterium]